MRMATVRTRVPPSTRGARWTPCKEPIALDSQQSWEGAGQTRARFLIPQLKQHRLMVRGVGLAVDHHVRDAEGQVLRDEDEIAGEGRPRPLQLVVHADRG